jgi:hypothetical protein
LSFIGNFVYPDLGLSPFLEKNSLTKLGGLVENDTGFRISEAMAAEIAYPGSCSGLLQVIRLGFIS